MTNNQPEYRALILGLKSVARYTPASVRVHMDSELVIRQMTGEYRVRDDALRPLFDEAHRLAAPFARTTTSGFGTPKATACCTRAPG